MMKPTFSAVLPLLALAFIALLHAPEATALDTIRVASGLNRPIYVTAPAGDDRLFIVEQRGVIKILDGGTVLATPFLNIDPLIVDIVGNDERGLLGLAFHPNYSTNGFFYVNYVNLNNDTVIKRYHVSPDPNVADPADSMTVIMIEQPAFNNHKGGHIAFGPNDCFLYIGMGDGGSGGDPQGNGQSDITLLAKILRINVNVDDFPADPLRNYAIPPDNPHIGAPPPLDEIWAKGVRNPYRWSFDRATGDLYIGEVGQVCWEEIDFQPASSAGGENYGWNRMEGLHCYDGIQCNPPLCTPVGVMPIHEYGHQEDPFGCSVTGGYVYRGAIANLPGTYFFADFCTSQIWSFRYVNNQVTEFTDRTAELAPGGGLLITGIAGFGEDGFGELYIVDRDEATTGEVYKVVDPGSPVAANPGQAFFGTACTTAGVDDAGAPRPRLLSLSPASPNPFSFSTTIGIELVRPGQLTLAIYDAAGRLVRNLVLEVPASGFRAFSWDGADALGAASPSGIYFLRAEVDGQSLTQRLCRVR